LTNKIVHLAFEKSSIDDVNQLAFGIKSLCFVKERNKETQGGRKNLQP
jgi:hypothetical protein